MVNIADKLMKIATFNIRYSPLSLNHSTHSGTQVHLTGDGEAPWLTRLPFIMDQVRWESPDIIGFQEVLEHQYRDLKNETALRDYTSIGVGRDGGITRGEYVPLFWKNDKFKALSVKHFWLSDQPDVPGSIGWDAGQPRMVTMVHLKPVSDTSRDGESTESFFVMNTHFDDRGLQARTESAKLILKKSNELIAETGLPILLMGDFNAPRQEAAYKVLTGKASEQASGQPTEHFSQDCAMRIERPYSMPQGICIEGEHKAHNEQIPAVTSSNSTAQHFKDSGAEVKRPYGSFEATFTGFYHNPKDAQVIDFIMFMPTAPNLWQVIKYGVIPNQFYNEPLASDHRMVSAVIQTA